MFVPVKRNSKKKPKIDVIASSLELLQSTIKNDPTKELLQILKDDMQHSREQETRQFNMLCELIRSNQSQQLPFAGNPHYNAGAPQQPHIPFSQPDGPTINSPQQSHMQFPHLNSPNIYSPQQPHIPFFQPHSSSMYPSQQSHLPCPAQTATSQSSPSSSSTHPLYPPVYEQPTYQELNFFTSQSTSGSKNT